MPQGARHYARLQAVSGNPVVGWIQSADQKPGCPIRPAHLPGKAAGKATNLEHVGQKGPADGLRQRVCFITSASGSLRGRLAQIRANIMLHGISSRFGTIGERQFAENAADIVTHRALTQKQLLRDFTIGFAFGY